MSDTPILDMFLPDLAEGIPVVFTDMVSIPPALPINCYEIGFDDAIDILANLSSTDMSEDGAITPAPLCSREAKKFLSFGEDVLGPLVSARVTFFAYPLPDSSGSCTAYVVALWRAKVTYGPDRILIATYSQDRDSPDWTRQVLPWAITDTPKGLAMVTEPPISQATYDAIGHKDKSSARLYDQMTGGIGLMIINRFLTKMAKHDAAEPVYRMSKGSAHKLYNSKRPKKAGIMAGPVRVLDLSQPKIVTIPVGPSVATGKTKKEHWRDGTIRVYRSARYKNMQGKTGPVRACGIHGAEPPDVVKTKVLGLAE